MIAPHLTTEAVNAVRTAALGDVAPDYWQLATGAVAHRVAHAATYDWPWITAGDALLLVGVIAERARREDMRHAIFAVAASPCRCGSLSCEHGDDMAAERPAEAAGF